MDDRFDWADYPADHVGPLAPPGATLVETSTNDCADIDECANKNDVDECADNESDDSDILDTDGTDYYVIRRKNWLY